MASGVLRGSGGPSRPESGAPLPRDLRGDPLTLLFLVCTFAGWFLGSLAGWLFDRDAGTASVGGTLGLSVGAWLAVLLERRGGTTSKEDSALANFGLVWVGWFVGLGPICFAAYSFQPYWAATTVHAAALTLPLQLAFALAWWVKLKRSPSVDAYLVLFTLFSLLCLAHGAVAQGWTAGPLKPILTMASLGYALGLIPAVWKRLFVRTVQ